MRYERSPSMGSVAAPHPERNARSDQEESHRNRTCRGECAMRPHATNKEEMYAQFGPKLVSKLPGPKARAAVEADHRLISPSYTRSYPLVAKRGRGVRLEDADGNEFLDFAAGIAVTSTRHCHPEVVKAIQQQAAELIHISGTDFYYENM